MKQKLMSRKLWLAVLSCIVSITVIFSDVVGFVGSILGIIGIVASSVSYMISESTVDVARMKLSAEEIKKIIDNLDKKESDK